MVVSYEFSRGDVGFLCSVFEGEKKWVFTFCELRRATTVRQHRYEIPPTTCVAVNSLTFRSREESCNWPTAPIGSQRNKKTSGAERWIAQTAFADKYVDKLNLAEEYARGEPFGLISVILAM